MTHLQNIKKFLGAIFEKNAINCFSRNTKIQNPIKEDTKNRRIFHAHGLEELTLLKCPQYLKKSTDSMQSL